MTTKSRAEGRMGALTPQGRLRPLVLSGAAKMFLAVRPPLQYFVRIERLQAASNSGSDFSSAIGRRELERVTCPKLQFPYVGSCNTTCPNTRSTKAGIIFIS